jgi:predicted amino acid dehydrogenase
MNTKDGFKYAFVANIIEDTDIRMTGFYPRLGRIIPIPVWRGIYVMGALAGNGFRCAAEYDTFGRATGYTILVTLTARQMVSNRWSWLGRQATLRACKYAQDVLKVDVIGLGSLTKSITNEGYFLKENGITIPVTHGDAYSVASGLNGIEMMCHRFNHQPRTIAVVGAYGKIGRAMTLILSREYDVVAMGRKPELLEKLEQETDGRVRTTTDMKEALNSSDLAVMTTSAPYSIVQEGLLEKGRSYYLYDLGQPYNLFPRQYWDLVKKGYRIIRVDGGFEGVRRPFDIGCWMRLNPGVMYACYSEVVTQALERDGNDYLGPVDIDHVMETRQRAQKWGFHHQPLSCFNRPLEEVLEEANTYWKGERA